MFTEYSRCACGAITVISDTGEQYAVASHLRRKFLPDIDLRKLRRHPVVTSCCDHCVNHYGLELCGCGSGYLFGKCPNDLPECAKPMQKLGEYTRVVADDAIPSIRNGGGHV